MTIMRNRLVIATVAAPLLLAACATTPMGPTVQVMPSPTKPFPIFQQDQEACKQYAQSQVAGQADAANQKAIGGAVLATALGAALGAAVDNHQGSGQLGAAGAITGAAIGAKTSSRAQLSIQDQYNTAYMQCMYSRGNQVPGMAQQQGNVPPGASTPPPADGSLPPPMTTKQAQAKLNAAGYPVGRPDGVFGQKSRQQLAKFQNDNGLPATGELDPNTVVALSKY